MAMNLVPKLKMLLEMSLNLLPLELLRRPSFHKLAVYCEAGGLLCYSFSHFLL